MGLKALSSELSLSRKTLILGVTAIITAFCLVVVFLGCTKEEVPVEATRQLVIPPELEPEAVLPSFSGEIFRECVYEVGKETGKDVETKTTVCINSLQDFVEGSLEEGFIKGCERSYSTYILKSGEEVGIAYPFIKILVLKYENPQASGDAFAAFVEPDLKDLIIEGVKVKWKHNPKEPIVYMLQSNNFIIYIDGSVAPCTDAVGRIIETYSAPKDTSY